MWGDRLALHGAWEGWSPLCSVLGPSSRRAVGLGLIDSVVGRRLARIFAVIAMGLGMGFLVWGISGAVSGERLRPPFGSDINTEVSEAMGWGAGFLTGGIVALVLSFLGKTRKSSPQASQGSEPTSGSAHHLV